MDWTQVTPFEFMFARAWEAVIFFLALFAVFYPTGIMKSYEWIFNDGR